MCSRPGSYCLTFMQPRDVRIVAGDSAVAPLGCELQADANLVRIYGPSRQAVFSTAAALLRGALGPFQGPLSVGAVLESPHPAGRDGWSICLGADVAFAPTSLGHEFPVMAAE